MADNYDLQPPEVIEGELCPMCNKNTLTLTQAEREIPYFGVISIFSMSCTDPECGYFKSDVEAAEEDNPKKYTFTVENEEDLKVRVIKSAAATIKIPHVATVKSCATSNGYVTNVEGIINRIKVQTEKARDSAEDQTARKKAKNIIKKLQKVLWGEEPLKIIIEDETGQSGIISDKTVIDKLKVKK